MHKTESNSCHQTEQSDELSSMDGSSDPPPAETCCSASQPTNDDACATGGCCARPGEDTAQAPCCNAADTPPPQPATNDACASSGCARQGDDADTVGAQAAAVRRELRQTGERVARSLAGDERIDSERRLLATVRILDDVDQVAEKMSSGSEQQRVSAGPLSSVSLLLDRAVVSYDVFRKELPASPDPYAS